MNSIKFNLLKKIINKSLGNLRVNVVLDLAEDLPETKKLIKDLKSEIKKQVNNAITYELVEQAFLLTKVDLNNTILVLVSRQLAPLLLNKKIYNDFVALLTVTANLAGQNAVDKLTNKDKETKFNLENKTIIDRRLQEMLPQLDVTTAKQITEKIQIARESFLEVNETTKYVKQELEKLTENRVETIVRNELANISGVIQNEVYKKSGVVELRWITARDEAVCEICEPLHNTIIRTGGLWVSQTSSGQYPPIHINCRCYVEPSERYGTNIWTGK